MLVALVLLLPRGRIPEVVLVGAMIGYAITIRPYWGIVVVLYVVGRILLPRVRGLVPVLIFVLVSYGCLQVVFNLFLGEALSFSRVAINDLRADINISVGSLIVDFLPDQVGLQWLNAFLVFLSLLFPWPLILGGSPVYLVMAVVLGFLWGLVAWSILQIQRERAAVRRGRPAQSVRGGLRGGALRAPPSETDAAPGTRGGASARPGHRPSDLRARLRVLRQAHRARASAVPRAAAADGSEVGGPRPPESAEPRSRPRPERTNLGD